MRRLKVDVATFTLIIGATNGAIYYLAPLIPDPGLRGFIVIFSEMFIVWLSTEEGGPAKGVSSTEAKLVSAGEIKPTVGTVSA